jgi:hypothetical protein
MPPQHLLPNNYVGRILSETKLLTSALLLKDVEPLLPLVLDRLKNIEVKVLDIRPDRNNEATDGIGIVLPVLPLHKEEAPPHAPLGVNAQEAFAKGNEIGVVKNGVGLSW